MRTRAVLFLCLSAHALPASAASISGQITLTGSGPIGGVTVNLLSAGSKGWAIAQSTTTNVSGNYSFSTGVGNYIVQAVPSQCLQSQRYYDVLPPNDNGFIEDSADVLQLSSAGTTITGINVVLIAGGSLSSTVTNGSVGIGGMQVRVEDRSDGRHHIDAVTSSSAGTLGQFTVCGLTSGQYLIWIHNPNAQYDDKVFPGPYTITAGSGQSLGNFIVQLMPADPYESNSTLATGTTVPSPAAWDSSSAILAPRGSDVDFYCFNALARDSYLLSTTTDTQILSDLRASPWVDPKIGWFSTTPVLLLLSSDDEPAGQFNAQLDTGVIATAGRYCVGVTSYGDGSFTGSGQTSAGRYVLHIATTILFRDGFEAGP